MRTLSKFEHRVNLRNRPYLVLALLVCGGSAFLALPGCESSTVSKSGDVTLVEPAPAPAPRKVDTPAVPEGMTRRSIAFPTGIRETSQVMLDRLTPAAVAVGQPYESTLVVTNISNVTLNDVVVSDMCSTNFKLESATPPAANKDGTLSWTLGTLNPSEARTISIKGSALAANNVKNCMNVTFSQTACINVAVVEPKLKLDAVATAEALKCDPIAIKYTLTNTGTGAAHNVVLRDELPAGLVTEDGKAVIAANVGTIEGGQAKSFTANLKATKTGKFANAVTASADGGLKADAATSTVVKEPILAVKQTGPATLYIGRSGTYTISVANTGDGDAANATLENALPANGKLVSAEGATAGTGKVAWNLGTLKAGDAKSVTYVVQAGGPGTLASTATLRATCGGLVSAPVATEVKGIPAILLEMVDLEDPIEVGKTVTYMITVTNQGTATDTNITMNCTLEDTMQYVSSSGASKGANDGLKISFDKLPSLAPKEKATWYVVVKAVKEGDVRFQTNINSDQLGRDVIKTESTHFYK